MKYTVEKEKSSEVSTFASAGSAGCLSRDKPIDRKGVVLSEAETEEVQDCDF